MMSDLAFYCNITLNCLLHLTNANCAAVALARARSRKLLHQLIYRLSSNCRFQVRASDSAALTAFSCEVYQRLDINGTLLHSARANRFKYLYGEKTL